MSEHSQHTALTPEQYDAIDHVMHSPEWYMNGRRMNPSHELYYQPWWLLNYCYFDLETNNLLFADEDKRTVREDFRTIQFYGENHYNRELFETYEQLIDPLFPIPPEATRIHGITDEMVEGKGDFADHWDAISELLNPVDGLVAFNGDRFDLPGLAYECIRSGIPYEEFEPVINKPHINLLVWEKESRGLNHKNRLEDISKRYGVKMMGRVAHGKEKLHDARIDVQAMAQLTLKMGEDLPFTLGKLVEKQAAYTHKQEEYFRKKRAAREERKRKKQKEKERSSGKAT